MESWRAFFALTRATVSRSFGTAGNDQRDVVIDGAQKCLVSRIWSCWAEHWTIGRPGLSVQWITIGQQQPVFDAAQMLRSRSGRKPQKQRFIPGQAAHAPGSCLHDTFVGTLENRRHTAHREGRFFCLGCKRSVVALGFCA